MDPNEQSDGPVFACAAREDGRPPHVAEQYDVNRLAQARGLGYIYHTPQRWWFLFVYPAVSVENIRIPTVADAGWIFYFRPAPDGAQIGYTLKLTGGAGYPEVVHRNRDCSALSGCPISFYEGQVENPWEPKCG